MCLFLEDSNYQPMRHMIILSNIPKSVAGQAPPNLSADHVCHIVVDLRKWHTVCLRTSSRAIVQDNFSFLNFIPFLL